MRPASRVVSPPNDVLRAVFRMGAALVGLVLMAVGVVWLLDGSSARWPAYIVWAAVAVIPAGVLLSVWQRLHMAAGRRVVAWTPWTDRDAPHYGWRIEAAIIGALLTLVTAGAVVGSVVHGVAAYQRSGWTVVEAHYIEREPCEASAAAAIDCPEAHRLRVDDDTAVLVPELSKSWPSDADLPDVLVAVYYEGEDLETAASESPTELTVIALLILLAAVPAVAGAWTVLSEAAYGPPKT